jgi:hypothetical protein
LPRGTYLLRNPVESHNVGRELVILLELPEDAIRKLSEYFEEHLEQMRRQRRAGNE